MACSRRLISRIVFSSLPLLTIMGALAYAEVQLTIHGDQDIGPVRARTGWVLGSDITLPYSKVAPLNTQSWRFDHFWFYPQASLNSNCREYRTLTCI